jgi:hypothetical protein
MITRKDLEAKCEELADLDKRITFECESWADWKSMSELEQQETEDGYRTIFKNGFRAALNLTWPMIEELKAKVEQYANNILIHDKRATGHLRDYNLECEISKMLEEGLKFYANSKWNENYPGGIVYGDSILDMGDIASETLSEVQKLRET